MKQFLYLLFIVLPLFCSSGYAAEVAARVEPFVQIRVDAGSPQWAISKYLTGSHFVYAYERDSLYEDERIADWMRRSKVGIIRWPGGTAVQNYHWDDLNGIAFKVDSWGPDYSETARAGDKFMDLDEFVAFCDRVGAEPMVGVNIKSGRTFDREADALDEARRLIQYCQDKHYRVKFWYIGNECYKGFGAESYAEYIDRYAKVLKAVDPDITIIADWKFGPERKNRFEETLRIARASGELDVMEIHEKWGNEWGLASGRSVADWRAESPIYNGRLGEYIRTFVAEMERAGRPQAKLAFNEWGLGYMQDGDAFDHALVAADFLIELFRNPVYQACYWNLNMGNKATRVLQTRKGRHELEKLGPVAHVFEMVACALGETLLPVSSSDPQVYGFAARDAEGMIQVFLLNKSEEVKTISVEFAGMDFEKGTVQIEAFATPGRRVVAKGERLRDGVPWRGKLGPSTFSRIRIESDTAR